MDQFTNPETWSSSMFTSVGVWVMALSLLGLLIRQIGPWKKLIDDKEKEFRDLLIQRVQRLEDRLERQERRHSAEQRHSNHKFRNVTACFDAILMMLRLSPEQVPEIVAEIEKMRANQMLAEAEEMKLIYGGEDYEPDETLNTGSNPG